MPFDLKTASEYNIKVVNQTKCSGRSGSDLFDCLLSLPAKDLVNAQLEQWNPAWLFGIVNKNSEPILPIPVIDGLVLPYTLEESFSTGKFNPVDIVIGNMAQEVDMGPLDLVINDTLSQYEDLIKKKF